MNDEEKLYRQRSSFRHLIEYCSCRIYSLPALLITLTNNNNPTTSTLFADDIE